WAMLETRGLVTSIPFGLLVGVLSVMLIADLLMARACASKAVYAVFNIVAGAAGAFWLQSLVGLASADITAKAVFASLVIILATDVAFMAPRLPKRGEMVLFFDISLIFGGLFIALSGSDILACRRLFTIWGLLGCIMALTALASLRLRAPQEGESPLRPVLSLLALLAFAGVLYLLSLLALGELESMSSTLVGFLKRAVSAIGAFILKVLNAILDWLNSLFREDMIYDFEADIYSQTIESNVYREYGSGRWILVSALVLVFGALVVMIIRLRGKRMKAKDDDSAVSDGKSSASRAGLPRLFRTLSGRFGFMLRYLKNRNSAPALFIWTERRLRKSGIRRRPDETPPSFLRTSAAAKAGNPGELAILADALEMQFYAGEEAVLPEGFASGFRKNFRISKQDPQARAQ
ncbi:MAG: hypothetical protein J5775_05945, partial [Spirochaetales bacterium]|nr:hypothetical protein [Spirochaetales bacterium]